MESKRVKLRDTANCWLPGAAGGENIELFFKTYTYKLSKLWDEMYSMRTIVNNIVLYT